MKLENYKTIVFDCDGVILNSNRVKTLAFFAAALPYGEQAAQALVDYHVANGGISRYKKFEYFLSHILGRSDVGDAEELKNLLEAYADKAWQGLLACEVAEDLAALRDKTTGSRWLVVSGGDQAEIRRLFGVRNLDRFFDGGIFGSPDSKDQILKREIGNGNIKKPAVFLGDTKYDYYAAEGAGLDFVFVSGWSEFADGHDFFSRRKITLVDGIGQLLQIFRFGDANR